MKPSSQGKNSTEARATYDKVIEIFFYFRPVEELDEVVHPKFLGYGTAAHEFFKDREALRNMAVMQAEQLRGTQYTLTRKPVFEKFLTDDSTFLILEDFELHMQDNNHTLQLRLSTILEKESGKWLITHFHGSSPDKDIAEEEAFPMEGLRKKNEELEAKIRERTRDLEIEAALDRVRAASMAMHQTQDIGAVVVVFFDQLKQLNIPFEQAWINIFHLEEGYLDTWLSPIDGIYPEPTHFKMPTYPWEETAIKSWKSGIPFSYLSLRTKEEVDQFSEACDEITNSKYFTHSQKKLRNNRLEFLEARHKYGFISKTSKEKPTKEDEEIMQRFAKVFEQTYTRFLDIEKAEAQAREAEIELAIERIRSQAMAMNESSELLDIVVTMRNEFIRLGYEAHYFWHMMWLPDKYEKAMTSGDGKRIGMVMELPRHIHGDIKLLANWEKSTKPLVVYPMDAEAAIDYVDKMINLGDFKQVDPNAPSHDDIRHIGGLTFIMARTTHGEIGYSLPGVVEQPPEEDLIILQRFAGAFDLAHRRFLDLKKSEAQAREVEIELALERVRARTMAMQHSDELQEASFLLDEQVRELGIQTWGCAFNIYREKDSIEWFGNEKGILPTYTVPRKGIFKKYYDLGQKGAQMHIEEIKGAKCISHYEYMSSLPVIGEVLKQLKETNGSYPEYQIDHVVYFKYGYLLFITTEQVPDSHDIFKRFAQVFEQTYTRFLDLQKAEAQAKEAQIEAALEKVRSQSLAMHTTSEMQLVANAVYDQLQELGVVMDAVGMSGVIEEKKDYDVWIGGAPMGKALRIPYNKDTKVQRDYNKAIKERPDLFARTYSGKVKEEYVNHLLTHGDFPRDLKRKMVTSSAFSTSISFAKNSSIQIARYSNNQYTAEENEILKRFAKVFEQAYIRFMDLQKAEKQAREAQIESSLERVRARSMAMHASDELNDVLSTLFQQFDVLGIKPVTAFLSLFDIENNTFTYRSTSKAGNRMQTQQVVDLNSMEIWQEMAEKWKKDKQDSLEVIYYSPEVLPQLFDLFEETFSAMPEEERMTIADYPNGGYSMHGYCKFGYLGYNHTSLPTDEEKEILIKFATEFGRVYQRFLDIQKAEAQARESQIEAALERVRARSMAMHSSEELNDVLSVLFQQIEVLGIDAKCAHLTLMDLENNSFSFRITGKNGAANIGEQIIDLNAMPIWKETVAKWKKAKPHSHQCLVYPPEVLPDLWKLIDTSLKSLPAKERIKIGDFPNGLFDCEGHNKFGYLGFNNSRPPTEEEISIAIRFAREFERVYQRFLDIKKAEAQTREAQIQLSLERVRARSMAMHSSEELNDVLSILFQQFDVLGIKPLNVWLSLYNLEENTFTYRATGTGGSRVQGQQVIDLGAMDIWQEQLEQWKSGNAEPVLVTFYPPEVLPQLMEVFKETFDAMPAEERMDPKLFPDGGYNVQGYTKFGYIGYNHLQAPTQEEKDILLKFATEFERVYQRFLDIEKAEAQTREAQIEAALEKVRSQSLSMHSTSEMQQVANAIYEQLEVLGLEMDHIGMSGIIELKKDYDVWIGGSPMGKALRIPYNEDTKVQRDYNQVIEERPELFARTYSGNIKKAYIKRLLSHGEFPKAQRKKMESSKAFTTMIATTKNSGVQIVRYTDKTFSEEEGELLKRFARVFEQAYIRFRDLEKSEAQAREAQIEAALEKVRSRSLAMQKPEELQEVITVVAEELKKLGVVLDVGGVVLCTYFTDSKDVIHWTASDDPKHPSVPFFLPYFKDSLFDEAWDSKLRGDTYFAKDFSFEVKNAWFEKAFEISDYGNLPDDYKNQLLNSDSHALAFAWAENSAIMVPSLEGNLPSKAEKEILIRFSRVFEQAYIRFMDLEKAEEQARESQIEHALEKVRSRTMAMQRSEELPEAANTLFLQVQSLGIPAWSAGYCIWESEDKKSASCNMSSEGELQKSFSLPTIGEGYNFYDPLKKGETFYVEELGGDKLVKHYEFMRTLPTVGEILDELLNAGLSLPTFQIFHILYFPQGYLMFITYEPVPEAHPIFKRFAKVFEQTYTRFMDLKKAEAQAREAQIESSLERVRSRSMAMHKSDEMLDLIVVVSEQLRQLNLKFDTVSFAKNDTEGAFTFWLSSRGQPQPLLMDVPPIDHPVINSVYEAKESGLSFISDIFSAAENKEWSKHIIKYSQLKEYPETVKDFILNAPGFARSSFFLKNIDLYVGNYKAVPYSDEENSIFRRFAKAFEQAYTRFLDLQKAESQAREAQIEAALERVRSKTMAMHNSQDVGATVVTLFDEVQKLGLDDTIRCGIGILEGTEKMETWSANATPEGKVDLIVGMLDMNIHPMLTGLKKAWKQGGKAYTYEFKDDDVKEYYGKLNQEPEYPFNADLENLPDRVFHNSFFYSAGILFAFTENPLSEEALKILQRFAGVFGQTYRRYLDLLKAEQQAREAQIEASLERIRARAMAMHHTDELTDVLGVLFDQFDFLGINPVLTHLTLFDEENETFTLRITTGGKKRVIAEQLIDVNAVESWKTSFANWKKSELHAVDFIEYPPEVLPDVWELLDEVMSALPDENKIYPEDFPDGLFTTQGHCKYGYIGFNHSRKATGEEVEIVIRFAKEFGRLYQRFLDIQKAELQARDALKQATLDRVRGQIASMRSTEDLDRITPLIWNELKALEIPFIRCGVFIINEPEKLVEAFLSAPDGHSLGVMKIPVHADKDTAATVAHWKKKQVYRTHWDKGQFLEFMQLMKDLEQVSNEKEYQGAEQPPESLHLHFVPFTQGMLYVGNVNPIEDEQIELIQTLADAFAIAYARYEDFVKLEKAKEQVENALEELKATQNQLVQSEKMASLGELTAGIAHEIQNPLNFVNNFSEVSVELLEEMLEEMRKGDLEEAKALMEDIKQNLDKINHHGKRADGIVKGMLQHSRTSSGEKELTDLNVLADEYLRLAYHGLRAKDKTFNATLETHFDESIGKVNILAQDMGRVILNLITNAFYVVKEKSSFAKASEDDSYEPTVTVSTKKTKNGVEISVKDNGNGIPDSIKEKIFQPFFTTKPTGEGTGLGLSMSYDIVTQGHGGELKVETKEGQGTTFFISIPYETKNN